MSETKKENKEEPPQKTKDILGLDIHFPNGVIRPSIYMVYSYHVNMGGTSKRVRGVYPTIEEAKVRQNNLIPDGKFGINGSRCGRDPNGWSLCTFINSYPLGDGDTEMNTTALPDWRCYA